ncbi:LamG-like jellyroll fold domain-containing protein [Actinoplanes sp. NPDC049596]|uniref:LamG-like jellyroll fold domain-containing protein n=1 Tax=unclassified Actinoplanes TaxID=2626549 RepID=UPI00341B9F08
MYTRLALCALVLALAAVTPAAASPPTVTDPAAASTPAAVKPAAVKPAKAGVRYTFDGPSPLADMSGRGIDLSPVSRYGGTFTTVAHNGGRALAFPPPCHNEPCPRIALRAVAAELNPGRRPIRYGAAVRLASDETTKGENILQKGFSRQGSQYKLQIDGLAGRPSCVFVDDRRPQIHAALAATSVADNRWHTLECRRSGPHLTILVDGTLRGETTIPTDLTVHNRLPFSIGGKGSFADNDQFQGTLDEVWVEIS